ncbi:MAG: hypothetical protein ACR2HH_01855 [Chthoniobacterales bacterium]
MSASLRKFLLYLDDQTTLEIDAESLASALANSGVNEAKTQVLAAIETKCLATPSDPSMPATIAILRNPTFLGKVFEG